MNTVVSRRTMCTHVHVDDHPVALVPINRRRHDHQGILGHEVPYASLRLPVVLGVRLQVEFEGLGAGDEEDETADVLQ